MAENRPPRMIMRRLFGGGGGKVVHPRNMANAAPARMGGRMGGMGMGGGGVARGFTQARESGDPALNGDYERMPYTTLYGFPIAGGGLSERGKEQQATSGRLQQYNQQIASAVQNGATFQEAFRGLVRSTPSALNDLMAHPTALQSIENLTQVLGSASQHTFSGVSPQGQQVEFDESGKAVGASDVPGFRGPPVKPEGNNLVKTDQGYVQVGKNTGTVTPVLGPGGAQLQPALSAKEQAAQANPVQVPSDIPGVGPQMARDNGNGKVTTKDINEISGATAILKDLQTLMQNASVAGLAKGPITTLSGQYFGLNGQGAQFKAALDNIRTNVPAFMGSGYKAATDNFMHGISGTNDAPSYIRTEASKMIRDVRERLQFVADNAAMRGQAKLPQTIENGLENVGVVSNGYQNSQTLNNMDPVTRGMWKARNAPLSLSDTDKAALYSNYANRGMVDPNDRQQVEGLYKKDLQQRQAQQAQQTASQAAQSVQPMPAQGQNKVLPGQVQPGANTNQVAAPPQTPSANGQAAPQGPQQLGNGQQQQQQPPQGAPPGQLAPGGALTQPVQPLMPPQEGQGEPAPGVPGTNGQTPLPAPNPLPQVSQTVQPGGQPPLPSAQPALNPASPSPNAQGASNALPGDQGEAEALGLAAAAQTGM